MKFDDEHEAFYRHARSIRKCSMVDFWDRRVSGRWDQILEGNESKCDKTSNESEWSISLATAEICLAITYSSLLLFIPSPGSVNPDSATSPLHTSVTCHSSVL